MKLSNEGSGMLPFGMTLDELKAGVSKIRNRVIARIFREMKLIEEWGGGYKRVMETCRNENYPEPQWIELGTVLRVVFHPYNNVPVNMRQQWFLKQIANGIKVKALQVASHWKVSIKTVKRDISELKERNRIEFIGSPKQGYYRIKV